MTLQSNILMIIIVLILHDYTFGYIYYGSIPIVLHFFDFQTITNE